MGTRKRKQLKAEMNIVPYVDVMFVLLTIFMVTATTISVGIDVDMPELETSKNVATEGDQMVISVNAEGAFFFNHANDPQKPLNEEDIRNDVLSFYKDHPDTIALVKGDKNAAYGRIIEAMAILQDVTQKNVQLMTTTSE